jgi:membrane associated rhomboid family serine protease
VLPLSDGLPARRLPVVSVALIAANIAVWVFYELGADADARVPLVGASGAISAVLGAFLVLYPHARIKMLVLVFFVQIPAWAYLDGWFVYQLDEAHDALFTASAEGSGVAFFAHVGGFVFGWITARALLDAGRIRSQSVLRCAALLPL